MLPLVKERLSKGINMPKSNDEQKTGDEELDEIITFLGGEILFGAETDDELEDLMERAGQALKALDKLAADKEKLQKRAHLRLVNCL